LVNQLFILFFKYFSKIPPKIPKYFSQFLFFSRWHVCSMQGKAKETQHAFIKCIQKYIF